MAKPRETNISQLLRERNDAVSDRVRFEALGYKYQQEASTAEQKLAACELERRTLMQALDKLTR